MRSAGAELVGVSKSSGGTFSKSRGRDQEGKEKGV